MHTLILVRHGESVWNAAGKFAGWTDVGLTPAGEKEAKNAAHVLQSQGYTFDMAFTSVLKRSIRTCHIILNEMDLLWIPVHKSWRLNERHYGKLQGMKKTQAIEQYGEEQITVWRNSYDHRPPPISPDDQRFPGKDVRYDDIDPADIPGSESLQDLYRRFRPYWDQAIVPSIKNGNRLLLVAHGKFMRTLLLHLEQDSDSPILQERILNGKPLVYQFDHNMKPIKRFYMD